MLRRIQPRATSGGALVFVLLAVMMVAALAASFLQVSSSVSRRQASAVDVKEAFYIAEAGLAESFAGLTVGRTGGVASEEEPAVFGKGLFWVEATELEPGLMELEATAMAGSGRVELSSVVRRGAIGVASLGVFADGALSVEPGAVVDGYNSQEGSYEELTAQERATFGGGRLGANGGVSIAGTPSEPTLVQGVVTAGPGQSVSTTGDVTITGGARNALVATELPPVQLPAIPLGSAVVHSDPLPMVLAPGEMGFASLTVGGQAELQIVGPVQLRVGSLRVLPAGRLVLDNAGGPIRIFVDDELALDPGSSLSVGSDDPAQLTLQVAGQPVDALPIMAQGAFYGVLYAPGADLDVDSGFEVFGALIGRDLNLLGPVRLHFDEHLLAASADSSLPTLVSWRILELAQVPGAKPGSSPFQLLGLDPTLLPRPGAAHADQYLEISYLDGGGTFRTWQGMESAFDWSTVSEPLAVQRDGSSVPGFEEPRTVAGATVAADPVLQALLDAIADSSLGSSDVRQLLLDNAPVHSDALSAALARFPAMGSSDLRDVLQANLPLPDAVLTEMLTISPMSDSHVETVLQSASPLSDTVLLATVDTTKLDSSQLRDVLIQNSPLSASVLLQLPLRLPPMNPLDLLAVQAAQ